MKISQPIAGLCLAALLSACGGGGGGENDAPAAALTNAVPLSNAGINQTATVGALVTLDGSGSTDSNQDALTYKWTMASKPIDSAALFTETTLIKPTLTRTMPGTYVFTLVVSDGKADSAPSTVAVAVTAAVGPVPARAPAPPEIEDLINTAVTNIPLWVKSPSTFKVIGTPTWAYYDTIGKPAEGAVTVNFDSQNGFGATIRTRAICPANWDTRGFWRNTMQSSLALCSFY